MSGRPLVVRDADGNVDSVLVASWSPVGSDPGAALCRLPSREGSSRLSLFRYLSEGAGTRWMEFDVERDRNGRLLLREVSDPGDDLSTRRIRWALREAGFAGTLLLPLWNDVVSGDLRVLVSDFEKDDPELSELVAAANEGRFSAKAFEDLIARLDLKQLVSDDGTEDDARVIGIFPPPRAGDFELVLGPWMNRTPDSIFKWYSAWFPTFEAFWQDLWASPEDRRIRPRERNFVVLRRDRLDEHLRTLFAPGELSVDEEEARLFQMLGEPSPLTLPGPELVRWALGRST